MATTRPNRILGLPAALALVAAISGCPVTSATPPQTPSGTAPIGAAPADTPPAALTPSLVLPSPSVDSDLEPEDNAAIENLLDSDDLAAYLPADLIHDGGVILFRTLATRPEATDKNTPIKDALAEASPAQTKPAGTAVTTAQFGPTLGPPPVDWRRAEGRRGGRQLTLRQEGVGNVGQPTILRDKRARVVVKYGVAGQLLFAANGRRVAKPFSQQFSRTFKFKLEDNRWLLDELTPLQHESQGGRSGIELDRVAVYAQGEATPRTEVTTEERFISPADVPTFARGESVRVEVTAARKNDAPVYVYAYMVGGTDRSRVLLQDDGANADRVAGDGIYSANFAVPTTPGLRHFGVDVINPAAFQAAGLVRSNGLGISFRVKAE